MQSLVKRVFVISDLHLGGKWAQTSQTDSQGFRIMTHPDILARFIRALAETPSREHETELVINGDFIDFLAEEHEGEKRWMPFIEKPQQAVAVFNRVVEREGDKEVFDALGEFVRRGHSLTVLLGNHDIELSLPAVRCAFERRLALGAGHSYRFLYDGEAYSVGQALIEHGNRYDPVNIVTHGGLRAIRSLQSRAQLKYQEGRFTPPAGSFVVSEVINPIKKDYPFIDLLKPESEPLFGLLLALEPGYIEKLDHLSKLARRLARTAAHGLEEPALPRYEGDIAASGTPEGSFFGDISAGSSEAEEGDDLRTLLCRGLSSETADALLESTQDEEELAYGQDISAISRPLAWLGLAKLLVAGEWTRAEKRVTAVQETLRALDEDRSFEQGYEAGRRYREAATELSNNYRIIVFGHTHKAKQVNLDTGATYINSGAWANLMRFPERLFVSDTAAALTALSEFLDDLRNNRLEEYIEFHPTYVRLEIEADGATRGELRRFESGDEILS